MNVNKPHHQKNISMMVDLVDWAAGILPGMGMFPPKSIDIPGFFYPLIIQ
jgi:hypothetical protein